MQQYEIGEIIGQIEQAVAHYEEGSIDWRSIWDAIKRTGRSFKETDFPSREAREADWKRFQSAVERVKELQATEFENRKQFRSSSEDTLYKIERLADLAMPDNGLADVILTVASGGVNILVKGALDAIFGKLDEELESLKKRSEWLREAGALFKESKHEMIGRHKHRAHEVLTRTRERLNEDWESYKSRRQSAFDAKQEAWKERQHEFEARRDRWRSNQEDFLDKLRDSMSRLESALGYKLNNRDKLENMMSNAKGDDFRSRVSDWIDENESAIDSIRNKISSLEDKIEEVREQLRSSS